TPMLPDLSWPWLALLGLGAFHGLNPGMGWLFAVALGMQEGRRAAVWRALGPLALGHALAVGAAVLVMALAGRLVPLDVLKWGVAGVLLAFGVYRLVRHGHPRYGGMRVGARDLTVWSFLMASAHGAGLMVLPFVFGTGAVGEAPAMPAGHDHAAHAPHAMPVADVAPAAGGHAAHAAHLLGDAAGDPLLGLAATALHTLGYLLVMGLLAVVVYEKLGLRLLRTHWLNLDYLWAAALILTAVLTSLL
ncbi:MAG TPA: hypothetical protein VK002_03525, partial [Rubricoccaceae bacterium]|nr:hypothetical protein [Rubricoccaceae bacterium]